MNPYEVICEILGHVVVVLLFIMYFFQFFLDSIFRFLFLFEERRMWRRIGV